MLIPQLLGVMLSVVYGLLLLFGLDASSRSLAPSAARRHRHRAREERRKAKQRHQNRRQSFKSQSKIASGPSSVSSDGSVQLDLNSGEESSYHYAMRSLHGYSEDARSAVKSCKEAASQTTEELAAFLWAVRSMVTVVVEAGVSLGGVGVGLLNEGVDDAVDEGRRIGTQVKEDLEVQNLTEPSFVP